MKINWNFLGGGGGGTKTFHWGSMDFSGTHNNVRKQNETKTK